MKRVTAMILAISMMVVFGLSSSAQTDTKYRDFNSFTTISVSGGFEVSLRVGYGYNVSWTYDTALADYIEIYVKNRVLNIEYNQKGMPNSLKKVYKGKNGRVPVLRAVVTVPQFSSIVLSDDAVLEGGGVAFESENFSLEASGSSKVTGLVFNADNATITLSKNANVAMNLNANKIGIKTSGNAILELVQDSDNLNIEATGSSSVSSKGNSMDINVIAQNSSKVLLDGSAKDIVVNGQNSAEINAINMFVNDAELTVNSAMVTVNAAENLSVDLKSGAKVYYNEDPIFKIVDISSSTLSKYSGEVPKRRGIKIF